MKTKLDIAINIVMVTESENMLKTPFVIGTHLYYQDAKDQANELLHRNQNWTVKIVTQKLTITVPAE